MDSKKIYEIAEKHCTMDLPSSGTPIASIQSVIAAIEEALALENEERSNDAYGDALDRGY